MSPRAQVFVAGLLLCVLAAHTEADPLRNRRCFIDWSKDGLANYTEDKPLELPLGAFLNLRCQFGVYSSVTVHPNLEEVENCILTQTITNDRRMGTCFNDSSGSVEVKLQTASNTLGDVFTFEEGETYYFTSFSPIDATISTVVEIPTNPNKTQCSVGLFLPLRIIPEETTEAPTIDTINSTDSEGGNNGTSNSTASSPSIPDDGRTNGPGNADNGDSTGGSGPGDLGDVDLPDIGGLGSDTIGPGEIAAIVVVIGLVAIISIILVIIFIAVRFKRTQQMSPNKGVFLNSTRVTESYRKMQPPSQPGTLVPPDSPTEPKLDCSVVIQNPTFDSPPSPPEKQTADFNPVSNELHYSQEDH